ncbi:hypothetical protein TNCV_4327541 [Trichonephila clavipes]|nr:hypothetical protein TNCV_4327541 [Trichonephila clavipes]
MHEKTIAVLQVSDLHFPLHIFLVGGSMIACDVRLRCNVNALHISSPPMYGANFAWFACFLQGGSFVRPAVLKFGSNAPFVEYRSVAKRVLRKSYPSWLFEGLIAA